MAVSFLDNVVFYPASTGTGDFVVASAVLGHQTPAQAGAVTGATYHYSAQSADLSQWEFGIGVYTVGSVTLARTTVVSNSLGTTAKINFATVPQVFITALARDMGGAPNGAVYFVALAGSTLQTIADVNAATFQPGDSILFAAGSTLSGAIVSPSTGTPSRPITFGSYGDGRATISSGNSNGFTSTNQSGIIVRDLIFTGSASTNHGILFQNTLAVAGHLPNVQAINCDVSGYGQNGIFATGSASGAGYDDIQFQRCTVSGCNTVAFSGNGTAGIIIQNVASFGIGSAAISFNNPVISGCISHDNAGCSDTNWTGSGIFMAQFSNGRIEFSTAYNNGASAVNSLGGGGPGGIWISDFNTGLINDCLCHDQQSGTTADGGGFNLDEGSVNGTIRNCYAHDNAGPGFEIFSGADGTVTGNDRCSILNCISENDGKGASNTNPCGISIGGNNAASTNYRVSGCTIYQSNASTHALSFTGSQAAAVTGLVHNNTFIVTGTQELINTSVNPSGVTFAGNNYKCTQGNFKIAWNGTTYTSVAAFYLGAGQENPNATNLSRLVLSGNTNFYITSGGSDTTGIGTSGNPWLTLQYAVNWIAGHVDFNGFTVTVNIGSGTFAGCYLTSFVGGGILDIAGNGNTNTTLQGVAHNLPYSYGAAFNMLLTTYNQVFIHDLAIDLSTCVYTAGIYLQGYNEVYLTNPANTAGIAFTLSAGKYCVATAGAFLADAQGNHPATITLNGTTAAGFLNDFGGSIISIGDTIALPNTPAWSAAFCNINDQTASGFYGSFSGTATGSRFFVTGGGIVDVFGAGLTYLPGNASGTIANGGIYG